MAISKSNLRATNIQTKLIGLYWAMRLSIAFIWIWTAAVSWFIYPKTESLNWLYQLGLTHHTDLWLIGACLLDMVMGVASALFASRMLWKLQFVVVIVYSCTTIIWLPELLIHPFGPITKNLAILACLTYLEITEK